MVQNPGELAAQRPESRAAPGAVDEAGAGDARGRIVAQSVAQMQQRIGTRLHFVGGYQRVCADRARGREMIYPTVDRVPIAAVGHREERYADGERLLKCRGELMVL